MRRPWSALAARWTPVCAAVLAACGGSEAPAPPAPPPLRLQPRLAELEGLAAQAKPPEPARLEQLLDLGRTAFVPGLADARLAARSREALLAEPDAVWALEQLLVHEDAAVRSHAAFALGEAGRPAAQLALALRLKYERDQGALVWIADALARLGNGCALGHLADAMAQAGVAQAAGTQAIAVLQRAGRTLPEQPGYAELQAGLRELRAHWLAHGALPGAEPAADPAFSARAAQRLLALVDVQLRPVDDTRFVLARCGRAGVPLLRLALTAAEPYLRTHSLEIVRDLGPVAAAAAPDVLPLLGDALCRADAARTLGALRAEQAAPLLRPWLALPDLELRTAAAAALGPLGDRGSEPLLLARMQDAAEAMDVRVAAAFSIAMLARDNPGLAFLRARLEAGDYHAPTLRELLERVAGGR